ncbi:MAG: UDP-3-O-(3-hydroxymyristoyl)glucosamine N-acyltransferase [Candidatus Margulisiibacteriota bacterium]
MKLSALASELNAIVIGDPDTEIVGVSSIDQAQPGHISFCFEDKYKPFLDQTQAAALVVKTAIETSSLPQLVVGNPRQAMAVLLARFNPEQPPDWAGSSAWVHPTAQVHPSVVLGPFACIEAGAVVGEGTSIGPHACVGSGVVVGTHVRLFAQVVLYPGVVVGNHVTIHAGTVIGSDGFGYHQDATGKSHKIPQVGRVRIGDAVEIGSNATIDRGTLGDTIIGSGTKIDNLVHIAHNTVIGEDCIITAQVGFVGGAKIGRRVVLAGQVGVNNIELGDDIVVAAKGGVTKSHKTKGMLSGYPARPHQQELEDQAILRRLIQNYKKQGGKKHAH